MKFFKQEKEYTCGVAITRTMLSYLRPNLDVPDEMELEILLECNNEIGTHPVKIKEYLESKYFRVWDVHPATIDSMKHEVKFGRKPIFLWCMYGGHYSIAWDYFEDETYDDGAFLIVDPAAHFNGRGTMQLISSSTLEDMWFEPNKNTYHYMMMVQT